MPSPSTRIPCAECGGRWRVCRQKSPLLPQYLCYECKAKYERKRERLHAQSNVLARKLRRKKGEKCEVCGVAGPVDAHHIRPLMEGGTNDEANLVLLCHACHMDAHGMKVRS